MSSPHKDSDIIDVEFVSDSQPVFKSSNKYKAPFKQGRPHIQKKQISVTKIVLFLAFLPLILAFSLIALFTFCVVFLLFMPKILRLIKVSQSSGFKNQFVTMRGIFNKR